MQNLENSTIILNQLKELGVLLSIDDFGTGNSLLSYLKHLPIDKIKIDKSFVDDIIYHSNQGIMVKTIIDMGLNLNFAVIAEGIETDEQLHFLKENECKFGQGYFFSKPIPAVQMNLSRHEKSSGIPI
jgi:EAL domain-containing protein (putative c-di-GMP-specific phosphodiesterase class I)